ncbi:hypothetical protein [Nocardia ninae]|uniref:hypothetical protein n=1 Tax=Nocardia ninae TaxID=356145 RepID=UPI0031E1511D
MSWAAARLTRRPSTSPIQPAFSASVTRAVRLSRISTSRGLRERQPSLDFASIDAVSRTLAGLFWARIETLSPGIDTLQIPPEVMRSWKDALGTIERTTISSNGERIKVPVPRLNLKDELMRVRALYLDIAHWAVEDPAC